MLHCTPICDQWEFARTELDTDYEHATQVPYAPICVPHDFLIEEQDLYRSCEGWYRRVIKPYPKGRTVICFDGVYMDSTLFVDGKPVSEWKYGYTAFEVDLTDVLPENGCMLYVRVRHQAPCSRWYSGAGIFRPVLLKNLPDSRFTSGGLYISASQGQDDKWALSVDAETDNAEGATIRHTLIAPDGEIAACFEGGLHQCRIVNHPAVWDTRSPQLYTLQSELCRDGEILDTERTRFGFRSFAFTTDQGFIQNGRPFKLNGVCQHHDLGALGSAVNKAALRRQITILISMGVNAIRTSHNPPAVELLDLCDELGVLVIDEAFDMWEGAKTTYDYARFFPEWHERDVRSWIRRDRNRACVILWSIGNEIGDTRTPRGLEVTKELTRLVRLHDPKQNAGVTIGSNYMQDDAAQACAEVYKVAGYNYAERLYASHRQKHPTYCIYGSETASVLSSRGIYHFPLSEPILSDEDLQCSALGNSTTAWGARDTEQALIDDRDCPYSAGTFLWSGFDYIGEPTPYQTRSCYFGQIDTAGFPKDAYYILKAAWCGEPLVHLFPYWDWNPGQLIDVRVCGNTSRVRVTLNGAILGETKLDARSGRFVATFSVPYAPGELMAEGLDDNGRVIARDVQRSFGEAARITLECAQHHLNADGLDMAFIEIGVLDAHGVPVMNAKNRMHVTVEGSAVLCGLDNGDSTDTEPYVCASRRLFSGKLLAMVMACTTPGSVTITVRSPGLEDAVMTLPVNAAALTPGIGAHAGIKDSSWPETDRPIRKIELIAQGEELLTKDVPECLVTYRILPENASYSDIAFRVVNASGVDSPCAECFVEGDFVRVRARGDGSFYLRATARNGKAHADLISSICFRAQGFGAALIDPYHFVSASLCDVMSGGFDRSGYEHGVKNGRDQSGLFGFSHVDFGAYGARTFTLPIFTHTSNPYEIRVWDGIPGQGGIQISTVTHQKPVIWNHYQETTCTLPMRLRGVHALCFEADEFMHIKGIVFEREQRAFHRVPADEADAIYGDAYERADGWVRGIGNNVTLEFRDMDMPSGAASVTLWGCAEIDNAVQLVWLGESGELARQSLRLPCAQTVWTHPLTAVKGVCAVRLIFLPGTRLDLQAIQFFPIGTSIQA